MKYITMLFAFLLPIVRKAAAQAALEELNKIVYPPRPRTGYGYTGYAPRPRTMEDVDRLEADRLSRRRATMNVGRAVREANAINLDGPGFHDVLMIAFDISGTNREIVENWLYQQMPNVDEIDEDTGVHVDSWWLADDNRLEPTDTDSAVFVSKGNQSAARALLREHGLLV